LRQDAAPSRHLAPTAAREPAAHLAVDHVGLAGVRAAIIITRGTNDDVVDAVAVDVAQDTAACRVAFCVALDDEAVSGRECTQIYNQRERRHNAYLSNHIGLHVSGIPNIKPSAPETGAATEWAATSAFEIHSAARMSAHVSS
jgi:hypothetical protein